MKLRTFNSANAAGRKTGTPRISFAKKGGVIRISQKAVDEIGLRAGNKVSISQDELNVKDWYLHLDKDGFELRADAAKGLVFNSSVIAEEIKCCVKNLNEEKGVQMLIQTEPIKVDKVSYYAILTASAH